MEITNNDNEYDKLIIKIMENLAKDNEVKNISSSHSALGESERA